MVKNILFIFLFKRSRRVSKDLKLDGIIIIEDRMDKYLFYDLNGKHRLVLTTYSRSRWLIKIYRKLLIKIFNTFYGTKIY